MGWYLGQYQTSPKTDVSRQFIQEDRIRLILSGATRLIDIHLGLVSCPVGKQVDSVLIQGDLKKA